MNNIEVRDIPLKILIVDQDPSAVQLLQQILEHDTTTLTVNAASSIHEAKGMLHQKDINAIFIDPLNVGLDAASEFIFGIRKSRPQIVFTLYVDRTSAEAQRAEFYKGERRRFSHYHYLDKRTPMAAFPDELQAVLHRAQQYLFRKTSKVNLDQLRREADKLVEHKSTNAQTQLAHEIRALVSRISPAALDEKSEGKKNTVFISYRFAEEDYVDGLTDLLKQSGFEVVTGQSSNTYISKAILDRIKGCEFFLSLMTRHERKADGSDSYTTSAWLFEEKGAAIAFGKPLILMIEKGITDIGGLEGDWQRIHFAPKQFLKAALEAVKQLNSYRGAQTR